MTVVFHERKILDVMRAIADASKIVPRGEPIKLHPNMLPAQYIPIVEIRAILTLLESENAIRILTPAIFDPVTREQKPEQHFTEYHTLKILEGFPVRFKLANMQEQKVYDELLAVYEERVRKERAKNPAANMIMQEGNYWLVRYEGKETRVKNSLGIVYLNYLLCHPKIPVPAIELQMLVHKPVPMKGMVEQQMSDNTDDERPSYNSTGDAARVIDDKTLKACKNKLLELDEIIEEAEAHNDLARLNKALREKEQIEDYLDQARGLRGRMRKFNDEQEKARKAVSSNIKRSIELIERYHPALCSHLRSSIHYGIDCEYKPIESVTWI